MAEAESVPPPPQGPPPKQFESKVNMIGECLTNLSGILETRRNRYAEAEEEGNCNRDDLVARKLLTVFKKCQQSMMKDSPEGYCIQMFRSMKTIQEYADFLNQRVTWEMLEAIVECLFKFIKKGQDEVKDMAIRTFYVLTTSCANGFLKYQKVQNGKTESFIEQILKQIEDLTSTLNDVQECSFYIALGYPLAVGRYDTVELEETLIKNYMTVANKIWKQSHDSLTATNILTAAIVHDILRSLRLNITASKVLGWVYVNQLTFLANNLLQMFKRLNWFEMQLDEPNHEKANADQKKAIIECEAIPEIKILILELWNHWIENLDNIVIENFIEALLDQFVNYFRMTRQIQPDVLKIMTTIVNKHGLSSEQFGKVLEGIFESSFCAVHRMGTGPFNEYEESYVDGYYKFIQALIRHCFANVWKDLNSPRFLAMFQSLIKGSKHFILTNVATLSLETLLDALNKIHELPGKFDFYKKFHHVLLERMIGLVGHPSHALYSCDRVLFLYTTILQFLLYAVHDGSVLSDRVESLLGDRTSQDMTRITTQVSLQIQTMFPQLKEVCGMVYVLGLHCGNAARFKPAVATFLTFLQDTAVGCEEKYSEYAKIQQDLANEDVFIPFTPATVYGPLTIKVDLDDMMDIGQSYSQWQY